MSAEEQLRLVLLARDGGSKEARDKLIEGSMRLVASVAHRYSGRGLPFDDLVSEGTIGLIQAIDRFDPTRGVKFTTFAARIIQHSIQRALGESMGMVRLPPKARRLVARWARENHRFKIVHGRPADPAVLAVQLGIPAQMLMNVERTRVLQSGAPSEDGGAELVAQLDGTRGAAGWVGAPGAEPGAPGLDSMARLREAMTELEASQAAVVRLHFGLSGARQLSMKEVARELGVSVGRAKHDLEAALAALRCAVRADGNTGTAGGANGVMANGTSAGATGRLHARDKGFARGHVERWNGTG